MTNTNPQTDAEAKLENIAKKIRDTVSGKESELWNQQLGKLDHPDWLDWFTESNMKKAAGAATIALVFSTALGFCAGYKAPHDSGISQTDHEQAMKALEEQHTRKIDELNTRHNTEKATLTTANANLQRQLNGALQRSAPGSSDAFDVWTTAAVRTSESGGQVLTAPSVFLATLDIQGRKQLFNDIADHGDDKFGMSNTLAFYRNPAAASDPSMHPYKVAVIPRVLMNSPEKIDAIEEGFNSMEMDIASKYPASQTPIGYRFDLVAGGAAGKGVITVTRDLHMDRRNTAADDMIEIARHDVR